MSPNDTIHALASGAPPSGVAIMRVSGPKASAICRAVVGAEPAAGLIGLRRIRDDTGGTIDEGLALFFASPNSFTGEDVLELQVHGSRAVVDSLTERLASLGSRQAEPGEFTRRAFENGRMDLTEIEGLADLLAAQTEAQRRLAVAQQGGALRDLYEGWAKSLLHIRAMIEAELDFADEEDVPDQAGAETFAKARSIGDEMRLHLSNGRDGEIIRDGFRIALLGPPNAGKSSLLNALVQREAAIVTDVPGTTRDVIEVSLQRKGMALVVVDTAGLRETSDVVEAEGVRRAHLAAADAEIRIWLSPNGEPAPDGLDSVAFRSKDDDGTAPRPSISMRRKDGLDEFWAIVDAHLATFGSRSDVMPTRARHRDGVSQALAHIEQVRDGTAPELQAEHLRAAAHALARITGRVDVEDLLGVIFSEFCVGK